MNPDWVVPSLPHRKEFFMPVKTHLTIGVLVFAALLRGESYKSPPQGPPVAWASNVNSFRINDLLTPSLKASVNQTVAQMNAVIALNTDYRAKVKLVDPVTVYSPILFYTQFTDRPNHRYAWVQYMMEFEISDIKYHFAGSWNSYPWNRKVSMAVDVRNFCSGWETGQGRIQIVADPNPPYLDPNVGYGESFVNALLGGALVPYLNARISTALTEPGMVSTTLPGEGYECSSIGASHGDPSTYDDDLILWNRRGDRPVVFSLPITVRPVSVKRLSAHRLDGEILYDPIESPALDFWAGFGRGYYQLPSMVEGQVVQLAEPPIQVYPHPNGGQLVVLANVVQSIAKIDGNFNVFPASVHYGNGIQKVIVWKTYWTWPAPPSNKPTKFIVPAYEVTFEVSAPVLPPIPVSF
jgi:hypothetical protein